MRTKAHVNPGKATFLGVRYGSERVVCKTSGFPGTDDVRFGNPAVRDESLGPVALRPHLSMSMPLQISFLDCLCNPLALIANVFIRGIALTERERCHI